MHDNKQGAEMNSEEQKVRRFIKRAEDIAEQTGIPQSQVERALIHDAAKSDSTRSVALDFVYSVISAVKNFIGEWTRRRGKDE